MRHLLYVLILFFPIASFGQDTTDARQPILFSVEIPPDRDFTAHYSGTMRSPIGIGAYTTKEGSYGLRFAARSFYNDDVVTTDFDLQIGDEDSGIVVIAGRTGSGVPTTMVLQTQQATLFGSESAVTGKKTFQRTATGGTTRTFDLDTWRLNTASVFLETGVTRSTNYQSAITEAGNVVYREHPDGHKTFHSNIGAGGMIRMFGHLSFIGGYNYTYGDLPPNHNVQFGIGYTFD